LHVALAGHARLFGLPSAPAQISAHWLGCGWPLISRTHWPLAVVPAGTSVGHGLAVEHLGEQKSPARPVMVTLISSALHGPAAGLP